MNTHADKIPKNTTPSSRQENQSATPFTDHRPEAVKQRKKQEVANNSPRVQQLKAYQKMANDNAASPPIQKKANKTGLPGTLKTGVENLSGYSMDDVEVYYNSDKPAQLNAHAYTQGTDIHLSGGQEKHLPHEAWHVVQQKQGRVQPTRQMKGTVNINDDAGLKKEADVMGLKASRIHQGPVVADPTTVENTQHPTKLLSTSVIQGAFILRLD